MEIVCGIASKIGEMLVEPTGRELGYLFWYKANIKTLDEETGKLKNKRGDIGMRIDAAVRNGDDILGEVKEWVSRVDDTLSELERWLEEDAKANKKWFPNLKLQHSLGRKAKKSCEEVLKLLQEGNFITISCAAPPTEMHISSSMKDFGSRKTILKQVMEALRNDKVNVVAICGMGGIGKTTMAKEVGKRAKDENLFGEVVMVTVSQNPNVHQMQDRIAERFGLKLEEKSIEERANKLGERITRETKRVLVILDDMWDVLNLKEVGIPCKILLTSRKEDVCKQMKSGESTFPMQVLTEKEGWSLFQEAAGISKSTCSRNLYHTAEEIAKECKGLPVAIVTVGGALKDRDEIEWNDALVQLRRSMVDSMLDTDVQVYSRIKLSFDLLRSKEAKSCFLLCCLFPQDFDISIQTLVRHGRGLHLFPGTDTMEETRNRVHAVVQNLKRCFLLMDGNEKESVKMHDIIRDVAISIAKTKEHGGFIVRCDDEMKEWPEMDSSEREECTAISLAFKDNMKHPTSLELYPKLKLLSLSCTAEYYCYYRYTLELLSSDDFFTGVKELKVLAFRKCRIQSPPASLQKAQDLRALLLEYCDLRMVDISLIGGLAKLEILSFMGSQIKELPKEIGNLQQLKVLDMTRSDGFHRIQPGTISRLTTLEELKIFEFKDWGSLGVDEISPLKNLKVLDISIPRVELIRQNAPFENLARFSIRIGKETYNLRTTTSALCFLHTDADAIKKSWFHPLVTKCELLVLGTISNLKNLIPHFGIDDHEYLRSLDISFCNDLEHLVKFTASNNNVVFPLLEEMDLTCVYGLKGFFSYKCDGDLQLPIDDARQFQNLKLLRLNGCGIMSFVFSTSSRPFPHLQKLDLIYCNSLEEIVCKQNRETDEMVLFPKLTQLNLHSTSSLISICRVMNEDDAAGTQLPPKDADEAEDNTKTSKPTLVPFKCMTWLPNLQSLSVRQCDSIKVLFSFHQNDSTAQLVLISNNITNNINVVDQPNDMEDESHMNKCCLIGCLPCTTTTTLTPSSTRPNVQGAINTSGFTKVDHPHKLDHDHKEEWLMNLEELEVNFCGSLEVIFDYGERPVAPALNKLNSLSLQLLKKLKHIWKKGPQHVKAIGFQNLKTLHLIRCGSLRYVFTAAIANLLVMLETLEVICCESILEVVVAKTEEEEEMNDVNVESSVVLFPNLVSIKLGGLPNLSCFCQHPYTSEFPSLERLQINTCPKLENFVATSNTLKAPKLKGVELGPNYGVKYVEISKEEDLNGIIQANKDKLKD